MRMGPMTKQPLPLGRRSFLQLSAFGVAAMALTAPVKALAVEANSSLSQLGRRIRDTYPARAARLASESNPRPWPHLRQKKNEPLLFVDNWLLPASIAQVAIDSPSHG